MQILFDIEGNDLLPKVSRIFCICTLNLDTGEMDSYLEHERDKFVADAAHWTTMIGHGILSYDLWVLWRVWNLKFEVGPDKFNGYPVKFVDTLTRSRYQNPDRGGHGLEFYGNLFGWSKTDWKDFSEYSEQLEAYCFNDVLLNEKVLRYLDKEIA